MIGLYLIQDGFISPAGLGLLLSACSFPAMFLPLIVGYIIDKTKEVQKTAFTLLIFTILGFTVFAGSIFIRSFSLSLLGLVIFGSGSSSIMAIQRMLITVYLKVNCASWSLLLSLLKM